MNKITIVGSINWDTNLRVPHLVRPGETIHAKEHYSAGGGKGANQAVAAQRAGSETYFIGAVGSDSMGESLLKQLQTEGINIAGVKTIANESTGQAFVTVDDSGENSITIYSGANFSFGVAEVQANQQLIIDSDFVIAQLETPLSATQAAFQLAHDHHVKTILNPAPAIDNLAPELLQLCDVIIPNETEAQTLTQIPVTDLTSARAAAKQLHQLGVPIVIITLGSQGAFLDDGQSSKLIPALKVNAVDTTAAGDTFIGAFSSVLQPDFSNLSAAILFGNQASALTVQRYGAQPSIPYQTEILQLSAKDVTD